MGLHFLHRAAANDASHDSGERYPQPQCHPETRTGLLADLLVWSSKNNPGSRILWLHGPAGAGKSAIAQSLCQKLEVEGRLGASFFFKRGHPSRGNATKLFPTIAYHLALLLPEFKGAIVKRMESDPSIVGKSLSIQLQKLIIEPYRDTTPTRAFVVILDGLDECEGEHVQQELLRSIAQSQLPLRFLIASRPEPYIAEIFREPCLNGFHRPLNIQQSFEDVRIYLRDEFARIHREHHETMLTVATPWPSPADINKLVSKSSGYFIYASTVIKFIDDKNFRPTERLDIIMGIAEPDFGSLFSALDQLYTQILTAVPARPQLLRILSVITARLYLCIPDIEQLLQLKPGDVRLTLRGLHSVIYVPPLLWYEPSLSSYNLRVHHASFLDFLNDPARSNMFHVGNVHRHSLAFDILKAFSYTHDDPTANYLGHISW
ncbi:hypothetical protein DFH09DRAFT_1022665 [Mycena vulgaris]|nr:hypothetical protein DFH09DRAFT_1022665 [Mycena vulgaris]